MALSIFLSPCVQDAAGWLYHHPSGHRNVALAGGLGMTSRGDRGDQPPCRLLHAARQQLAAGEGLVAFPLAYLALGLQTGNTSAARSSRDLLAFFRIIHEIWTCFLMEALSGFVRLIGQLPGLEGSGKR